MNTHGTFREHLEAKGYDANTVEWFCAELERALAQHAIAKAVTERPKPASKQHARST